MKRQGLRVTLNDLRMLQRDLIKEHQDLNKQCGVKDSENYIDWNQSFIIGIVNKIPECSDTWEIEK